MAEKVEVIVTATDQTSGVLSGISKVGKNLAGVLGGLATTGFAAAGAGLTAVGGALAFSISEAMGAQEVMAQLNAVLTSTGGLAGVTADMATDLADSLSSVTRYEDDAILAGEAMLLTFTNIGKDVFPATTQTMLDMSTAMSQDLSQSAVQLGKALNDPINGVGALSRIGVTFTEEQKGMIKSLVESGDLMGAQTIILQELQKEFGGSAEAAGKTFAGQLDILKNTFGNVAESIGTAFLPTLQEMGQRLITFVQGDQFQGWVEKISTWLMEELPKAIQTASDFWRNDLQPALAELWPVLRDNLIPALVELGRILGEVLPRVTSFMTQTWELWLKAFSFVNPFFEVIKSFTDLKQSITNLHDQLLKFDWYQTGVNIVTGLFNGIQDTITNVVNAGSELGSKLLNSFTDLFKMHSPSQVTADMGVNIVRGLIQGLTEEEGKAVAAGKAFAISVARAIYEPLFNTMGWFTIFDMGKQIPKNIQLGIHENLPLATDSASYLAKMVLVEIGEFFVMTYKIGGDVPSDLAQGMMDGVDPLRETAYLLGRGTTQTILDGLGDINHIGMLIPQSLADGIRSFAKDAINAALEMANGVVSVIKDVLKINSPSAVMIDEVGKQMAAGIGVGLQRGITGMSTNVTAGLSMLAPATASTVAPIGGGRSVTVVIQAGTLLSFADEMQLEAKLKPMIRRWQNV